MKKQIISFTLLATGFLVGASALSALAANTPWHSPSSAPPTCDGSLDPGCLAPINVGPNAQTQVKSDSLQINSSLGVVGDLIVGRLASVSQLRVGPSSVAGQVLTAVDNQGTATWGTANSTMVCTPINLSGSGTNISQTGSTYDGTWESAQVPNECKDGVCTIFMIVRDSSNVVKEVDAASLIQISSATSLNRRGDISSWWIKTGAAKDSTACNSGKNGTTDGCDGLLAYSDNSTLKLFDDGQNQGSGVGNGISDWAMRDSKNFTAELYSCI